MRKLTTPEGRYLRLTKVCGCLALAACAVALPSSAEPSDGGFCPSNFQCSSRMKVLVATGVQQSDSFRSLVGTLGSHPEVSLELKFGRPRTEVRAHSDLKVRFVYLIESGRPRRQNTGVSGTVTVPKVAFAHRQIALVAHELAHVLIRLHGGEPIPWDEEERRANQIEEQVLSELELTRAVKRDQS